jgi:hypothetical protein
VTSISIRKGLFIYFTSKYYFLFSLVHIFIFLLQRSLMKKRNEILQLQESTKSLKEEIKMKKKSIVTLETLLLDTSRNQREVHFYYYIVIILLIKSYQSLLIKSRKLYQSSNKKRKHRVKLTMRIIKSNKNLIIQKDKIIFM